MNKESKESGISKSFKDTTTRKVQTSKGRTLYPHHANPRFPPSASSFVRRRPHSSPVPMGSGWIEGGSIDVPHWRSTPVKEGARVETANVTESFHLLSRWKGTC